MANKNNQNKKGAKNINPSTGKEKLTKTPKHFKRRIGSTTFLVAVHFNPMAKETAESKISRLVRMDADMQKGVGA